MKIATATYVDLDGNTWDLKDLDAQERTVLKELQLFAAKCRKKAGERVQRWCDFDNFRLPKVIDLYESRGLTRRQIINTPLFEIGQDISGRLGIALGLVRKPDYRDRLEKLADLKFKSRRDFCKATGLSEDMLSHVLAGRKDLSVKALSQALDRIGYTIKFVPQEKSKTKSA
jgi:hypothetical protein